jgi:adenine-specific DNA-methyltransferase
VFRLDSSNLKQWDSSPITDYENAEEILLERFMNHLDILKRDRSPEDVIFEVMLKLGQDLCETITPLEVNGKTVYAVGEEVTFIVCLAEDIQAEDAEAMAAYAPGRIIFADRCFTTTEQKSNVRLTLKDKGITIKTL